MPRGIRFACYFLVFLTSCKAPKKDAEAQVQQPAPAPVETVTQRDAILSDVSCLADPGQSYALFLPARYADTLRFPVIVFLDPQGHGRFPMEKYLALARKREFILIGSNNCKNGLTFEQTTKIIAGLVREASLRWNARDVSLAGFSGGAKAALYAAQEVNVLAVAYCGASISFAGVHNLPPMVGFTGERDMNYFETWNASHELGNLPVLHSMIDWKGGHAWPDADVFDAAFDFFDYCAMRKGTLQRDDARILATKKLLETGIKSAKPFQKATLASRGIAFLDGLEDVSTFRSAMEEVSRSSDFQSEMKARQEVYTQESNLRNYYMSCMESKDTGWWRAEMARIKSVKGAQSSLYERISGYISLAAYMMSRDAVDRNQAPQARQYLSVYKIADSTNPEQPYLEACLRARQGDTGGALLSLQEAWKLGFGDKARMDAEPAFQGLRNMAVYQQLARK